MKLPSAGCLLLLLIPGCGAPFAAGAAVRPHPRIDMTADDLRQMKVLAASRDPRWVRLEKWARQPHRDVFEVNAIVSCSLAHLLSGDRAHFDCAWDMIRGQIFRNGRDRGQGLIPLLESHRNDRHYAAYAGGGYLAAVARFYDWCHASLSPEQRSDVAQWLREAAAFSHLENPEGGQYIRNDGMAVTHGVTAAAYALQGDRPDAGEMLAWVRERWRETLRVLDIWGKGGATGEGNGYGTSPTAAHLIHAANVAWTAAGEDLFATHVWFRQRLAYDAFAAYPGTVGGPASPIGFPPAPMVDQASIGGDEVRTSTTWHDRFLRHNGLILSRRFADTDEASIWNWVYRQPEVDHPVHEADAIDDVLYWIPRPRLVKPKRLSHFDPSMGYVYIRSDWDSPDATFVSMWAGPHTDTHEHLDKGAFTIFKRRDLAPKTGHYDTDVFYPHHLAWFTRTVSANAILVGDPKEIFRHFIAGMGCDENGKPSRIMGDATWPACIPNDGGQRTMGPASMGAANADRFEKFRDNFEVARVVAFRDNATAVAVAADITNAYNNPRYTTPGNSPKVNRVWRHLVYVRPLDIVVVADTVESTDPGFEKKWLLHALERIEVGGRVRAVAEGESIHAGADEARIIVDDTDPSDKNQKTFDMRSGYAALLVKTLFPAHFEYHKVGGRTPAATVHGDLFSPGKNAGHFHRHIRDFWVKDYSEGVILNHQSLNWAPEFPLELRVPENLSTYGPGYGRWRLEVVPTEPRKTDYFLNVLKPTVNRDETLPPMRKIETPDAFGVEFGAKEKAIRVVFRKDALEAASIEPASP